MIDQEYFKDHFLKQFDQLGSARATVVLHNGLEFSVHRIDEALPNYVLLTVYPQEGVDHETRERHRKRGGTGDVVWDRVVIPYEAISHVWLSVTTPEQISEMGFRK